MVNIATCRRAAAAWQALVMLLVNWVTRGQGTSQYEIAIPAHIVLCKTVPAEVEAGYYRFASSPSSWR